MPPLIIPSSTTADGVALSTYRQRLAKQLGYYATGTVTTVAAGLESQRYIISSTLQSDQAAPDLWDGLYVYITSGAQAGEQRRVVNGAYDGPVGSLLVDRVYAAALASASGFEISVLPAEPYLGASGLNEIINEALEQLGVGDFVQVTAVAGQTQYSFEDYPWPVKGVDAVYYPRTSLTAERRRETPKFWDWMLDGESPVLSFRTETFTAGDIFEVKLRRPAHTRIRQSGTWGDSLVGLVNDTDQALYDVPTVVRQAYPIALARKALLHPEGSKERLGLQADARDEELRAVLSRFHSSFRGSGAQKVRGTGGR